MENLSKFMVKLFQNKTKQFLLKMCSVFCSILPENSTEPKTYQVCSVTFLEIDPYLFLSSFNVGEDKNTLLEHSSWKRNHFTLFSLSGARTQARAHPVVHRQWWGPQILPALLKNSTPQIYICQMIHPRSQYQNSSFFHFTSSRT